MRIRAAVFVCLASSVLGCIEDPLPDADASLGERDASALDADDSLGDGGASDDAGARADSGAPLDAGALDSGVDAASVTDAGPPDAGPPDPRSCPAGMADGCCPLALRYGGADPDCASLACATATLTEPIVLDDVPPAYAGTAAMSWTGHELRIAWTDLDSAAGESIWVERRSADGSLRSGPTRRDVSLTAPSRFFLAGAALGYAPETDEALFVSLGASLHAIAIDAADAPAWIADLPPSCNGFHQPVSAYDTGSAWLVAQVQESCASPVSPTVRLTRVARDGTIGDAITAPARHRLGLSTAYDGANEVALFYSGPSPSGNADLRARVVDVAAWTVGTEEILIPISSSSVSLDQAEAGYDGTVYGIVYDLYSPVGASRWLTQFVTWSPGESPSAPTTLFSSSDRRFAQARVVGNADGWTIAMTTVASTGTGLAPSASDDPEVWLYRLAPDGRVRQSLQIDADQFAARLPDLEWVGGRIALTWAREDRDRREWHMLSFLGCD
jgi:hypothetical protein